jgi:hypothetical protein
VRLKKKLSYREEACDSGCFCSGDVECLGGQTLIEIETGNRKRGRSGAGATPR